MGRSMRRDDDLSHVTSIRRNGSQKPREKRAASREWPEGSRRMKWEENRCDWELEGSPCLVFGVQNTGGVWAEALMLRIDI